MKISLIKGFEWVEADDLENSVYVYLRKGKKEMTF
jgi:1,4-alpha-glucan branching enzyme